MGEVGNGLMLLTWPILIVYKINKKALQPLKLAQFRLLLLVSWLDMLLALLK